MSLTTTEVVDRLQAAGRIQEVTMGALVKCGIKGFCWLTPGTLTLTLALTLTLTQTLTLTLTL